MTSFPSLPPITDEERQKRRLAAEWADRMCDQEGLPPTSAYALALSEQYIDGTLSEEEELRLLVSYHTVRDAKP